MEQMMEYLPLLIPYIVVELALAITALVHVLKHPQYRFGNKALWVALVVLVQLIGPIVYFIFGRSENE